MMRPIDVPAIVARYRSQLDAITDLLASKNKRFTPLSADEITAIHSQVPLPDPYVAFLAGVGGLGDLFDVSDGASPGVITGADDDERARMAQPFGVRPEHTYPVLEAQGIAARYWLFETCCAYFQRQGVLPKDRTHAELFGTGDIRAGRVQIGNSESQNELYLILDGPFAGDVWVEVFGDETWCVLGPALPVARCDLLEYMRRSLEHAFRGDEAADFEYLMW
jgi:hypothetical protein